MHGFPSARRYLCRLAVLLSMAYSDGATDAGFYDKLLIDGHLEGPRGGALIILPDPSESLMPRYSAEPAYATVLVLLVWVMAYNCFAQLRFMAREDVLATDEQARRLRCLVVLNWTTHTLVAVLCAVLAWAEFRFRGMFLPPWLFRMLKIHYFVVVVFAQLLFISASTVISSYIEKLPIRNADLENTFILLRNALWQPWRALRIFSSSLPRSRKACGEGGS